MNKILKLTLILCLVCAITAGVLGVVNELTYDRIQEQNRIKTENAYKHVLLAQGYEDIGYEDVPGGIIDKISRGTGGEGYVVELTFSGAQGNITLAVGVDSQLLCSGISTGFATFCNPLTALDVISNAIMDTSLCNRYAQTFLFARLSFFCLVYRTVHLKN